VKPLVKIVVEDGIASLASAPKGVLVLIEDRDEGAEDPVIRKLSWMVGDGAVCEIPVPPFKHGLSACTQSRRLRMAIRAGYRPDRGEGR
jgi:hypothetical protein